VELYNLGPKIWVPPKNWWQHTFKNWHTSILLPITFGSLWMTSPNLSTWCAARQG